jgi:hypothetical protein
VGFYINTPPMKTLPCLQRFFVTVLFVFPILSVQSQDESPPSLSMGLDHLVFGKGVIDVELLSDIIANKQDELKREFIKRTVVNGVANNNFTFYNYASNTLDLILKEKNKKVITREVMEYTANFALVYGIAELYIELELKSRAENNPETPLFLVLNDFKVQPSDLAISSDKIFKLERL